MITAREMIERERRKLSLPECEHGWIDQEFLSPVVYDTCPHCRIKELSAAAERVIERLSRERDEARDSASEWLQIAKHREDERDELRTEVERLWALLRDIDKAWSALDQSDLIVITDEEYRLGHDAPYNAMASLMLNVRAAVGEVRP